MSSRGTAATALRSAVARGQQPPTKEWLTRMGAGASESAYARDSVASCRIDRGAQRPSEWVPAADLMWSAVSSRVLPQFQLETRPIGVVDPQLLLGAVAGLNDVALRAQLETIALVAERYKVSSVARVARRRPRASDVLLGSIR